LKCGVWEDRDQRVFCGNWILEVERRRSWRCERLVDGRVIEFLMEIWALCVGMRSGKVWRGFGGGLCALLDLANVHEVLQKFFMPCRGLRRLAKVVEDLQRFVKTCRGLWSLAEVHEGLQKFFLSCRGLWRLTELLKVSQRFLKTI
jgi:hypothetical protein